MIRVLVVEDSTTARTLLVSILRGDPAIEVVGEAKNGEEGVRLADRLRPDVVTMDVQMPILDGIQATKQIMEIAPTRVIVVSASHFDDVGASMEAIRAGALTVLDKPQGPGSPEFDDLAARLVDSVKSLAEVKVVRRWAERPRDLSAPVVSLRAGGVGLVAIATSTGGPAALHRILSRLPKTFGAPILVVQHIAVGFGKGFADWLATAGPLRVKIAGNGERLEPGVVYIAPDDLHLGVSDAKTVLTSNKPSIAGFRPSGTFLFQSVAENFGSKAAGVVLTGMGTDGLDGLRALKAAGGVILAQDERSSVVYGMNAAAIEANLADEVLALEDVAARLVSLVV